MILGMFHNKKPVSLKNSLAVKIFLLIPVPYYSAASKLFLLLICIPGKYAIRFNTEPI